MECSGKKRTFVKTAMDAYEFPKLMPTMEGTAETSIGASAVPLGMIPLGAIVYGVFKGTRVWGTVLIKILATHGRKNQQRVNARHFCNFILSDNNVGSAHYVHNMAVILLERVEVLCIGADTQSARNRRAEEQIYY
jgi:hypothetical protein